jgi:hypothetical protein
MTCAAWGSVVCQPSDHAVAAQIKCGGVIAAGAAREGVGEAGGGGESWC